MVNRMCRSRTMPSALGASSKLENLDGLAVDPSADGLGVNNRLIARRVHQLPANAPARRAPAARHWAARLEAGVPMPPPDAPGAKGSVKKAASKKPAAAKSARVPTSRSNSKQAAVLPCCVSPKSPRFRSSRCRINDQRECKRVPGIRVGDYIFLSGIVPVDPQTGERSHGPIAEQVRTTLSNMQQMLESAGSSLERVVRVHVVLAEISDMAEMDQVYRKFFPVDPPTRTVWSMQLRFGNGCEIECVALAG
jgi:2-iminobutanoate/2-iminopropanoate deaminase